MAIGIEESIRKRIASTERLMSQIKDRTTYAYLEGMYSLKCDYEAVKDEENACKWAREITDKLSHNEIKYPDNKETRKKVNDMWVHSYDTLARSGDFEAFCIAMEWNRPVHQQFYLPRAKLLKKHGVVQAIQDLIDDKLDLLVLNMPPRTAKSTTGLFLQCLLGSISPDESILAAGHTAGLVQSFYSELLSLMTDPQYRYSEIFPNNKIVNKSAEYLYIDLNKKRRFHTYNYVSIETGGTGKVQAERLLYCDDLVKDVEQANNPDRLDKLYHNFTGTIKDRKIMRLCKDGKYRPCPEIHINTPWSLHDVTSRVVANAKEDDPSRVRIISVPCYDENGESNFMYDYGKGFSTKYYKDMEVAEDPVIFSAKYLMEPVERDGLLFNKDNITYYSELPGRKPDLVVAYQDVSHGGEDYFSMPVGYVYGNEVYIVDVLFRHKFGGDNYIRPLVRDMLIKYGVMKCGVERNNGGDFFSTLVIQDLRAAGYRCNVMDFAAPTNQSKLNRILAVQDDIKGIATINNTYRVYFKNLEDIKGNEDYTEAMHNLFKWNQNPNMQTKQHDDFPDSLAGMITNVLGESSKGVARSNIRAEELGL